MERLTEEAWGNLDPWECCGQDHYCQRGCHEVGGCTNGCIVPRLYKRLAAYEDTMPLERAQELAQAEKEGRLIVSPCKVGQEVFYLDEGFMNEICPAIVVGIEINGHTPQCPVWLRIEYTSQVIGKHEYFSRTDMMLGKTVFLTREEAEAALKKREADNEAD